MIHLTAKRTLSFSLGLLSLAAGCGSPTSTLPTTYPVTGEVYYSTGKPAAEGLIEFRSRSDPSLTISGAIEKDGRFSLSTLARNSKAQGAPEGEYDVTFIPPQDETQSAEPVTLTQLYRVTPSEKHFKITLPAR